MPKRSADALSRWRRKGTIHAVPAQHPRTLDRPQCAACPDRHWLISSRRLAPTLSLRLRTGPQSKPQAFCLFFLAHYDQATPPASSRRAEWRGGGAGPLQPAMAQCWARAAARSIRGAGPDTRSAVAPKAKDAAEHASRHSLHVRAGGRCAAGGVPVRSDGSGCMASARTRGSGRLWPPIDALRMLEWTTCVLPSECPRWACFESAQPVHLHLRASSCCCFWSRNFYYIMGLECSRAGRAWPSAVLGCGHARYCAGVVSKHMAPRRLS